jgi:hypothetical protein
LLSALLSAQFAAFWEHRHLSHQWRENRKPLGKKDASLFAGTTWVATIAQRQSFG